MDHKGLQRFIILFFIECHRGGDRRNFGRVERTPELGRPESDRLSRWIAGRQALPDSIDRDQLFTDEFLSTLKHAGVESLKLPPRSPNLNAHAERFVRSIKESCLERLILFGEGPCAQPVQNFVPTSSAPSKSRGNRLILPNHADLGSAGGHSMSPAIGRTPEILLPGCSLSHPGFKRSTSSGLVVKPAQPFLDRLPSGSNRICTAICNWAEM